MAFYKIDDSMEFPGVPDGVGSSSPAPMSGVGDGSNSDILLNLIKRGQNEGLVSKPPTEADMNAAVGDYKEAANPSWSPGLKGIAALALLHMLGGRAGARSAAQSISGFTQGYMGGREQSIKANTAAALDRIKRLHEQGKEGADLFKAGIGPMITQTIQTQGELAREKIKQAAEKKDSVPTDLKIFSALYPDVDVSSPQGRQAFLALQGQLKSDPYMPLAVQLIVNDRDSFRSTADQKLQAAQRLAENMKQQRIGGGSPQTPTYIPQFR